jgi:PucR family transcriptional regulator, purine catabolism regulatory protein
VRVLDQNIHFSKANHFALEDDHSLEFQRMLSIPSSAMGELRQELIITLGNERAKGFLLRYGWNCGVSDGAKMKKRKWKNALDALYAGPKMHTLHGYVNVEPLVTEVDFEKKTLHFEGNWKDSYEAQEHMKLFGASQHPVCHTLVGYASGYLTTIMGTTVITKETQCVAKGDECCHWICKTLEEWEAGDNSIKQDLLLYKADRIADELDETYEKLRIERDNLSKTYHVHQKIIKEVLRETGLQSIAQVLNQTMDMPVLIEDSHFSLLASGGLAAKKGQIYSDQFKQWIRTKQKSKNRADVKQTMLIEVSPDHRRAITPIYLRQNVYGYCSFIYHDALIKEVDKMVLEQAALACSLYLLNERTRFNTEQRMRGSFLEELLSKRMNMQEIVKRAHYIDFKLEEPYFMMAINRRSVKPSLKEEMEFDEQFMNGLQRFFKSKNVNALISRKAENVLLLLSESAILAVNLKKEHFCEQLLEYCSKSSPHFLFKMGVSSSSPSIERSDQLYEESVAALKAANRQQNLVHFGNLGLIGILLQARNLDTIESFAYKVLGNLIEEDKGKNMELTKTLYYYLENGCNVHKTARAMNLSISGLRYRLGRINEILQLEINTPYIRHEIYLALQALFVLGQLEIE